MHTSLPSRRFFSPGATTENMTAFAGYCHRIVAVLENNNALLGFEHFNVIAVVYKSCGERKAPPTLGLIVDLLASQRW